MLVAHDMTLDKAGSNAEAHSIVANKVSGIRDSVETIVKRWDRDYIETAGDRFRFQTLQSRLAAFTDLWDRSMRA